MNRSFFPAVALISLLGLLGGPAARAQTPTISPPTTTAPVLPINQPQTFRYTDADGMGTITFVDLGQDSVSGFDQLRVTITQNGANFTGSGIATPLPGADRPLNNLVSFTVTDTAQNSYFFSGKMGLGVEYQGTGTYHPVSDPTQLASWGLLFVAGTTPPPTTSTLSLSIDRGCGNSYPFGSTIVVTYGATTNDTLTLVEQFPDGTQQVIFTNRPVTGGQSSSLTGTIGGQGGQRTLILSNAAGAQVSCAFTATSTP
jgi:filamentous hemagglutinin family protein